MGGRGKVVEDDDWLVGLDSLHAERLIRVSEDKTLSRGQDGGRIGIVILGAFNDIGLGLLIVKNISQLTLFPSFSILTMIVAPMVSAQKTLKLGNSVSSVSCM